MERLLTMKNTVQFLHEEGPCTNFVSVISCALSLRSPSFKGRRMGGNNMSTLERICAQCQGKMARFEILRQHAHTLIYFITSTQLYTQQLNTLKCVLL